MNHDTYSGRYTPTSPLSPRLHASQQPLSPQPTRGRPAPHARQPSRNLHMTLPRFHPANFGHLDSPATPSSSVQSPAIGLNRVTQPVVMESPRLMREKQREFIERTTLSAKIAASSMGIKPGAPRLDPLGSPKGPVTPLALEEGDDYFQVAGAGKVSPAGSPGPARSPRSDGSPDKEESKKNKKVRQADVYQ
ncbi:uncharacterized protein Z519_03195 [Cladophialophora bantiana CBS 173.52]|uniref:Uncharacterized protein n=1 Tax=Cladophialophora bantiana (strain ATCC 10958 / CBS 173.52 / CDC B-1940 / NIH 8579) TaxID=1442370 RepID=A0A0D2HRL5_CLAB1|nr:uncharacterized protein Z519_03195 [Cladophialophora bantiana CBS 173.52]KIW96128.1 hypothetical protein Z519_03195 [Cladophialophora bantiana CBS 173.52]